VPRGDATGVGGKSVRERRRAAAVLEIVVAAEEQIAKDGPQGLTLRGIARDLGMSVQTPR